MTVSQWIDLPPVWLCAAAILVWFIGQIAPMDTALGDLLGWVLIGAGVALMLVALRDMRRAKTTVIPHQQPDALVTTGIFSKSRNPIYLGDLLVLAGLCLVWGALLALPLVRALWTVLTRRFIDGEEARLMTAFGDRFAVYTATVPRWI